MNHGLCPIDHTVLMRVEAGIELKMVNSKKSEKLDGENRVLIILYLSSILILWMKLIHRFS